MPKNKGAGGKNRRKGKGNNMATRELVYKEDGQEYGQISKSIGNGFMEVVCFTNNGNITRRAKIRGSMTRRIWMTVGDIVLVSVRGFQDATCDIVLKYTNDEARLLRTRGYIPNTIELNKNNSTPEENTIIFGEGDDNDEPKTNIKMVAKQNRNLDLPPSDSENESSDSDITLDDI